LFEIRSYNNDLFFEKMNLLFIKSILKIAEGINSIIPKIFVPNAIQLWKIK